MPSYEHLQLIKLITTLDRLPDDPEELSRWVTAEAHLQLVRDDKSDEIIIYASGPYSFIHATIMQEARLSSTSPYDLQDYTCHPFASAASYVYGGGELTPWIETQGSSSSGRLSDAGMNLVFVRTIEGWTGEDRKYVELNQEFSHLAEIHWRPEENAYCRFDRNGDLQPVVSVTIRNDDGVTLVSAHRAELMRYLAIGHLTLLRRFDFTLLRRSGFGGWPKGDEITTETGDMFYRQKVSGTAGYTHGVQIVAPTAAEAGRALKNDFGVDVDERYCEFLVQDERYDRVLEISTNPAASTNYFEREDGKPFELSPAFFRPEVLSKYKTDRDKYIVGDRDVTCRSAWHLRGFDVNEAGQVHAYLCDLRKLPFAEQLHWKSFNEPPKGTISERARINDFHGEFVNYQHPREEIMSIVRRWMDRGPDWWRLRDERLLDRANPPVSTSVDEWAEAFLDLSKLVIEGFETKVLRGHLASRGVPYDETDGSLKLLERLISAGLPEEAQARLHALREAQLIRSKVKGHPGGQEARELIKKAKVTYGSLREHFTHLCGRIAEEMEAVALRLEGVA